MSTVIQCNSPVFGIASQRLACMLCSGKEKLRTLQYYSVASCCVLAAAGEQADATASLEHLLETIESMRACEILCSRAHHTFEYAFNHIAIAMWNLAHGCNHDGDIELASSSTIYIQHLFRLLQQPELFPSCAKQLIACIQRPTNSQESLGKDMARMLSALELFPTIKEKAWLKLGGLVHVKSRGIGLLLPRSTSSSSANDEEEEEEDDDEALIAGRIAAASKLQVYFPATNVQDTVDMDHITREHSEGGWVETRLLILLSLALRAKSRDAWAFVGKLLSLCNSSQTLALDKAVDVALQSNADFLPEACAVFAKYGNLALAHGVLARWIAHTGKWPPSQICNQFGLTTGKFPRIVFSFPLRLTHHCFLKSPKLWTNVQLEKWRVSLPKVRKMGRIDAPQSEDRKECFAVRCDDGGVTVRAELDDIEFLFEDPALEQATVEDLRIEGICAFKALRGNCNLILFGGTAQFHDEPPLPALAVKDAAVPKPLLLPKSTLVKPVFGAKPKPTIPASPPAIAVPAVVDTLAAVVSAVAATSTAVARVKTTPPTKPTPPPNSSNKLATPSTPMPLPSTRYKLATPSTPIPLPSTRYKLPSPAPAVKLQSTSTTFPLPAQSTKLTPQSSKINSQLPVASSAAHQALASPNLQRTVTAPVAAADAVVDLIDGDDADDAPPKKKAKPSDIVDLTLDD